MLNRAVRNLTVNQLYAASMSENHSAPAASSSTTATTPNRGRTNATNHAESALRESSLIADADASTDRLTTTGNARLPRRYQDMPDLELAPERSSWPDTIREATAIDINIAGFRINFRVGVLLIVLLCLGFLYLIIQAKTAIHPQRIGLLSEHELKDNLSRAISNVTTESLESKTMLFEKMSTTEGRILLILAWCATMLNHRSAVRWLALS